MIGATSAPPGSCRVANALATGSCMSVERGCAQSKTSCLPMTCRCPFPMLPSAHIPCRQPIAAAANLLWRLGGGWGMLGLHHEQETVTY